MNGWLGRLGPVITYALIVPTQYLTNVRKNDRIVIQQPVLLEHCNRLVRSLVGKLP